MGMLDGRVVIVTGAGRGLGRAHCLELGRHGATVIVNDLVGDPTEGDDADPASGVVGEITAAGGTAQADNTNVTDFDGIGAMVERVVKEHGRLDAVVNNAGILRDRMLTGMSEAEFDAVIAVHMKGTFCLTRHACVYWKDQSKAGERVSGRVVNTTSGAGLWGNIGQVNYSGAKAGIVGMTVVTAMEMERYGVTANVVSPIARTRMTQNLGNWEADGGFDKFEPGNTSPAVAWLASEQSGWITGAVLRVDGDTLMRVQGYSIDPVAQYRTGVGEQLDATKIDQGFRKAFGLAPGGIPNSALAKR